MRPIQQLRYWLRRAPWGERMVVAAAAVALLLVAVLLAPEAREDEVVAGDAPAPAVAATTQHAAGEAVTATAREPVAGTDEAARPSGPTAGAADAERSTAIATTRGGSCTSPPGSDQGVSSAEIQVAVVLIDLIGPAANSSFGLPSAEDQRRYYESVVADLNASGGVACRRLSLRFHAANPADQGQQQQRCLEIAATRPFVVVDPGAYNQSSVQQCFPQNQLPYVGFTLADRDSETHYPYVFGLTNVDLTNRNGIFGLHSLGFFDAAKGFERLGFIYRSCFPDSIDALAQAMRSVGLPDDRIVRYDVGCPATFATPADLQQAVLDFRRKGVTHVTTGYFLADFANFTRIAQQQGFKPRYGLSDDGIVSSAGGALAPDPNNIDGALDITSGRYGENTTPGFQPGRETQRCSRIHAAKGMPPVYEQPSGFGGRACNQLWMVAAAISNAPSLERRALAAGLQTSRAAELSFPNGPGDFSRPRTTSAGQFWRALSFSAACNCWRVSDPTFRPSFPSA